MRRGIRAAAWLAVLLPLGHNDAAAQNPVRTLDIGGPPGESRVQRCYTDSLLAAALALYNGPAAVRVYGDFPMGVNAALRATVGVYRGSLRVDGTIDGSAVVLDGDARITANGTITGDVVVLGGRLIVDPGARIGGRRIECDQAVALARSPDGMLAPEPPRRSLAHLTSDLAVTVGNARFAPHIGIGTYNRVEAAPLQLGGKAEWAPNGIDTLGFDAYGIVRTGRDPSGSRPTVGWSLAGSWAHGGALPFLLHINGGATIESTADHPYGELESALGAFLLRRDERDWYLRRGVVVSGELRPTTEISLGAGFEASRQTSVLAIDAFSLFRGTETWRPNPLIDDGKYRIVSARVRWNARDEVRHPLFGWYVDAEVRRTTSNDVSPVSLPTSIRDSVPTSGYGSTDGSFDVRGYLRLGPSQRIAARIFGAGYLGGDPLTIQNRRAVGGLDPLPGYDFRAINCDRRRKADPALPALCDRAMAIQLEYRRRLDIDLTTRIGGYNLGIRDPDLVLLGDAASAWLAGESAGRVPAGRIQAIGEWQSDVGAGITTSVLGLYVAKSLVGSGGVKLQLVINRRF